MKIIPLTKGQCAFVSDRDYDRLSAFNWYAVRGSKTWYAARHSLTCEGTPRRTIYMHRQILGLTAGMVTNGDHRDCNGLNNQRGNLRRASVSQNRANQREFHNACGFKGVKKLRGCRRWSARIKVNKTEMYLGSFTSPEMAHHAYAVAARKFFGQFARSK